MIVLDTTVLVYAVGEEHHLRIPCRELLAAHARQQIEVTTTVEVVQEFAHVRARRRTRADAVDIARSFAAAFTLLTTRAEDLELGLSIWEDNGTLGPFDCVLAAVVLNWKADALVSADKGFATISELPWVDPATQRFRELLGT